ncbi:helicase C-terminal domain-containing protein [Methanobrevibacter millerae]|nr:helicase C-terminal domain-containing protein [Methanobrevibacter millerae]
MVKRDLINLEDKLYVNLINNLTQRNTIRLNSQFIPKNENNGLIRFFEDDSIWFSRLKKSNEIIYYFGLMINSDSNHQDKNPLLIMKFNKNTKKSNLRIHKNKIYLIVKLQDKIKQYADSKFKFIKANKKPNSKLRYLILDEIDSPNMIQTIKDLLEEFSFNCELDKQFLEIKKNHDETLIKYTVHTSSKTEIDTNPKTENDKKKIPLTKTDKNKNNEQKISKNYSKHQYNPSFPFENDINIDLNDISLPENNVDISDELDTIIFNINAFNLINKIIYLENLDYSSKNSLIQYIFNKDEHNNYLFSLDILNHFNDKITDESYIFSILNLVFENENLTFEEYYSEIDSLLNFKLSKNYDLHKKVLSKTKNKELEINPNQDSNILTSISQNKYDPKLEKKLFKYDEKDLISIIIKYKDYINPLKDLTTEQIMNINFDYNLISKLIMNYMYDEIYSELDNFNEYKVPDIVKENFPFEKPRELQLETISKIYDAIENGYKYIILEAVSGFGKSLIATTLTNIYSKEKSYILTTTNQLINQYIDEFGEKIVHLKPRNKSTCKKFTTKKHTYKCSEFRCRYLKCKYYQNSKFSEGFNESESCEYLYKLKEGRKYDTLISTYAYFLKETFFHKNNLKTRKLIICDEGHNIDDKISDSVALDIKEKQFDEELGLNMDYEYKYISQNEDYYFYLLKFKKIYESEIKEMGKNNENYGKYKKRLKDIEKFMSYFDKSNENLTFDKTADNHFGKKYPKFQFKPVTVKKMIHDCLFNYGDVTIFMSSSIFDYENFAYDLDINRNEVYSLRVPNIFDITNNPVKIYNDFNMDNEHIENGIMDDTLSVIEDILKKHKNEKGVIHTSNSEQVNFLKNNIDDSRILNYYFKNREEELDYFKSSTKPLVLISPSMNEGTDLPGDLCRFQIIFKLPYLPSEDPRIKKRKNAYEDGKEWYRFKMLTRLIQGYGRGIRFEDDYCKTYILDNRLWEIIYEDLDTNNIIPKYFINAIEDFNEDI